MSHDFRIEMRPSELGGRWELRLFQNGVEMETRIFQPRTETTNGTKIDVGYEMWAAYESARFEGLSWKIWADSYYKNGDKS